MNTLRTVLVLFILSTLGGCDLLGIDDEVSPIAKSSQTVDNVGRD